MATLNYDRIAAKLDALLERQDAPRKAKAAGSAPAPCGKGWIGTKPPGCKRPGKGEGAAKAATSTKAKAGSKPKAATTKAKKGKATEALEELKSAMAERGGAIVPTSKPKEEAKGKKKILSSQDAIDAKYASSNPNAKDVEGWKRETAIAKSKPSKKRAQEEAMRDMMIDHGIDKKPKTIDGLAEQIYAKEQSYVKNHGTSGQYTWKNFAGYQNPERDIAEAEARVKKAKNEASREKAQKSLDRLKANIKEDRETAEANADRYNKRNAKTKDQRVAEIKEKYQTKLKDAQDKQADVHEKVLKGNKSAINDVTRRHVIEQLVKENGLNDGGKGFKLDEAIKNHLKKSNSSNPVKILGVDPNATPEEVKAAYRKKSRELHPDLNPGKDTKAKMQDLNAAYAKYMKGIREKSDSLADQMLREVFRTDSADMSSYWRIVDLSLEWGVPIDFVGAA